MQDLINRAGRFLRSIKYKVETEIDALYERDAVNGQILYEEGLRLLAEKRLEPAVRVFEQAIEADAELGPAYLWRGITCLQLNDAEAAHEDLTDAVNLLPNDARAHYALGLAHAARKHYADAASCFRKALQLDAELTEAYKGLAEAERDQNRLEASRIAYTDYLNRQAGDQAARLERARILRRLRLSDQALTETERVIEAKPDFYQAHTFRAVLLQEKNRLDEALASYDRALTLAPQSPGGLRLRSQARHLAGNTEGALADLDTLVELQPENPETYFLRAEYAAARQEEEEMYVELRTALELGLDPKRIRLSEALAAYQKSEAFQSLLKS